MLVARRFSAARGPHGVRFWSRRWSEGAMHPGPDAPGRRGRLPRRSAPSRLSCCPKGPRRLASPGHGPHVAFHAATESRKLLLSFDDGPDCAAHRSSSTSSTARAEGNLFRHRLAAQGRAAGGHRTPRSGPQDRRARPPGRQPHDEPPRSLSEPDASRRGDRRQLRAHRGDDRRAAVSLSRRRTAPSATAWRRR